MRTQAKVEKLWQAKLRTGKNITQEVNSMRPYRNPDFLQKMVDFFGIDHTGTCFAPDIWDPKSLPAEDFYDRCGWEGGSNMPAHLGPCCTLCATI